MTFKSPVNIGELYPAVESIESNVLLSDRAAMKLQNVDHTNVK